MGVERLEKLHIYLKGRSCDNVFKWSFYPRQVGKTSFQLLLSSIRPEYLKLEKIGTFNRYGIAFI